jgi:hypothetical protein
MITKAKASWIVTAIVVIWSSLLIFPIMECTDGCGCGYRRTWYVMPDSPWPQKPIFMKVADPGDPQHEHQIWDATWGVAYKLPWQN